MRMCIGHSYGEVDTLPGCSQVAVSHAVFVPAEHRGKGVGQEDHSNRLNMIQALGYDAIVCTVDMSNAPQVHILQKKGWSLAQTFISTKTGHKVGIYIYVF